MADDPKSLLGLLNGIAKRTYYHEEGITNEFLKSELYPDVQEEDFERLITKCTALMKNMVSADMDLNQSEAFLTAQMNKKEHGITEEQAAVFRKFWKSHKNKIHESIIIHTTWNNSLKQVSWRIDLKSQARHLDQINTPTAIMELQVGKNGDETEKDSSEVIRFEMDESKLSSVLQSMKEIEDEINKHCQQ
ncbi:hypothetical protein ACJMK2_036479 [Sinanodonta woodiana]|uniref:COMM domain-containing protein 1 n=1 Tax=Sinanodonta woodiana TaxID=1069815 RepID=A0ABD3WHB1_SINWO